MTAPFALVLAAGGSRRFGSPKALAYFKGRTLIKLAVERVRAVVGEGFAVVVGAHADDLLSVTDLAPAQIIRSEDWNFGHAASLRDGVTRTPDAAPGALITLVDQPLVTADDLDRLISAWEKAPTWAAAAEYAGDHGTALIGAPCILPRAWFASVKALRGDRGASALLRSSSRVVRVPMQSAAHDIDTPEDLERLSILEG